jgi:predicted nucleotidyltransferase
MTDQHPITPPLELQDKWRQDWYKSKVKHIQLEDHIAAKAARWGADQELEACATYIARSGKHYLLSDELICARRPKAPTLKEQALQSVKRFESGQDLMGDLDTIRRALEALPND